MTGGPSGLAGREAPTLGPAMSEQPPQTHQEPDRRIPIIRLPAMNPTPLRQIGVRVLIALALLGITVGVVLLDRDGYRDGNGDGNLSVLDALYYATVTITTTGYGDIVPVTPGARLVSVVVVTPLRVGFLVVLVGTTMEVLATRSREQWRILRWRKRLRDHTVVVGFGTKGRSAVDTLISGGVEPEQIVVVDPSPQAINEANSLGLGGIVGDATRATVLRRTEVASASRVIVTTFRDDTAVLVTLTARQLNPEAPIIAAVRESENIPLLRQSGATLVVTSSDSVGRILGLSTVSPALGTVLQDLLTYGEGMEVAERPVLPREVGSTPRALEDVVVAVVRDGTVYRYFDPTVSQLLRGDTVVVIRSAQELPWASRPGTEESDDADDADEAGASEDRAGDQSRENE